MDEENFTKEISELKKGDLVELVLTFDAKRNIFQGKEFYLPNPELATERTHLIEPQKHSGYVTGINKNFLSLNNEWSEKDAKYCEKNKVEIGGIKYHFSVIDFIKRR